MAQFSNHLKILLTKPITKIQEAKLVERPRHVRRSVRKRKVGVVQASQPHFIAVIYGFPPNLKTTVWTYNIEDKTTVS